MTRGVHSGFLLLRCLLSCGFVVSANGADKPNLLIFYADDLGWGELGCQGNSQIPTPYIDSLANNGIRFTQGYVAATYCSPSRAGLMTGRYPTRFGHENNAVPNAVGLSANEVTLPDRLKAQGYSSCCVGKWHLGGQPANRPTRRGFDEFFGTLANTPFYHPTQFVDSRVSLEARRQEDPEFYTTDKYADRSIDWLDKNQGKPWFLYLAFNAQHEPLQAPQKYLDRFPEIQSEKRRMFAAALSAMDDAVGRVLEKIRHLGHEENTLIFFVSDNGGPTLTTTSKNGGLHGFKATTYEGGTRVPFLAQWKGHLPAGKTYDFPVVNLDILPTALAAGGTSVDPAWKLDGVNLLPYLKGENPSRPHETLYWRFGQQWAIREGDLKLVVARGGKGQPELYDLSKDFAEANDLSDSQPEIVKKLQAKWNAWSSEQAPASAVEQPRAIKNKKKKAAA